MSAIPPTPTASYPARLAIDYPDKPLNRLTSFFRLLTVIPIVVVLGLLTNASASWGNQAANSWRAALAGGGALFLPLVLMILFRQKYPRWWYDWNLALTKFCYRVSAYVLLLRDEYPSTDEEQAVHLEFPYPDAQKLSRGLPLIKWLLAIPHFVILAILAVAGVVCWIIAWIAILFTGRYPKSLFNFIVGVQRWALSVEAYDLLLVTDFYPTFSLQP